MDSTEKNTKPPENSVGQYIKTAREALGVDLDTLASETKLKRPLLEALESNNTKELPPIPYIKAFLVTLCKRLELDSEELFNRLNTQLGIHPDSDLDPEQRENLNVKPSSRSFMPIILISILVGIFLVVMVKMQGGQKPEPAANNTQNKLDSLPGLSEMESTPMDSMDSAKLEGSLESDSSSDSFDEKPVEVKTPPKEASPPPVSEKDLPTPDKPSSSFSNGILVLSCVTDSVWINIKRNGRKEINKMLKLGGQWRIGMTDSIYVNAGVHKAVEFNLNGVTVSPEERKFKIINGVYSPDQNP